MAMESEANTKPDIYYEITLGTCLVGQAALQAYLDAGGHPADTYPIEQVLIGDTVPVPSDPNKLEVDDWTSEDYVTFCSWVLSRIDPNPMSGKVLDRAYAAGFGPEKQRITRKTNGGNPPRFKSLGSFNREIGAKNVLQRRVYDDWMLDHV